eukprot:2129210-Rhodomonas_salina.2
MAGKSLLGHIDEFHLKKLFAKLCNSWREVGRMQFTVLLRTVQYSEVHGGSFVLEVGTPCPGLNPICFPVLISGVGLNQCVEAVNALRAKSKSSDPLGRRRSSASSIVDDLAIHLHTGPEEVISRFTATTTCRIGAALMGNLFQLRRS